jgi:hypothetical protein
MQTRSIMAASLVAWSSMQVQSSMIGLVGSRVGELPAFLVRRYSWAVARSRAGSRHVGWCTSDRSGGRSSIGTLITAPFSQGRT